MVLNVAFGFIVPWVLVAFILRKDRKSLFLGAPIGAVSAFVINELGFHMNFWRMKPFELHALSAMPLDIGMYPVLSAFFIHNVRKNKNNLTLLIFMFSMITALMEYFGVIIGWIRYYNGWNIYYTFLSYLAAFCISALYYHSIRKQYFLTGCCRKIDIDDDK